MRSKTVSFILTMAAVTSCIWPVQAAVQTAAENHTIQIAIPISSSTMDRETSSAYIGYTLEYLSEISQYTGWEYEVIEVPGSYEEGLQSALDLLRAGTVDFVAPIRYSENFQKGIYFSQNSYTTEMTVLQVPNSVYDGGDLGDNLYVAALKGSCMQESADQFFTKNEIAAHYVICQNVEEQIEMVRSGRADVMLNSNLEYIPNMTVMAEFSPQCLYFAAGEESLLQELDRAILHIQQANTSFSSDLYKKYLADMSEEFTLEERLFIEQSDPYVVAVFAHHAPYQYIDSETGAYCGISVDMLNYISQKTGLKFEFVAVESWDELLPLIQENKVHIVAEIPFDYDFAFDRNLTVTRNYVSAPYVLVAKNSFQGPSSGQKLALLEVSTYRDGYYIGDVVRYSTMGECIEAVRSGMADYTYVDLYTSQYYLKDSRYNTLDLTPQSYTPRFVCFGLVKPTPHELLSILNKSINQLSTTEMQNIITQNVNPPRKITIMDVMVSNPKESLMAGGVISLCIAGLLVFLLWRKEQISKALRKKAMEDGLTHLYNASACRKLISQKIKQMKLEQMGVFLIMDMDHFKEINDNHGHHTGDGILQEFADLLRTTLREESVIARIGGDEFVVYLDSIKSTETIFAICERIRSEAHSICIEGKPVTISIGAVAVQANDNYDTLYRMADKALYEAKRNQRDQFCLANRMEHPIVTLGNIVNRSS